MGQFHKTFFFVIYAPPQKASAFVNGKHFRVLLIFKGKARSLPSKEHLLGAPLNQIRLAFSSFVQYLPVSSRVEHLSGDLSVVSSWLCMQISAYAGNACHGQTH
jgi:hypothetical protein